MAPREESTAPREESKAAAPEVITLPLRGISPGHGMALMAGVIRVVPSVAATSAPLERGLSFEALTLDDFALRCKALNAFAFTSSFLRSWEIELSLAQRPLEEVALRLEAIAWQVRACMNPSRFWPLGR